MKRLLALLLSAALLFSLAPVASAADAAAVSEEEVSLPAAFRAPQAPADAELLPQQLDLDVPSDAARLLFDEPAEAEIDEPAEAEIDEPSEAEADEPLLGANGTSGGISWTVEGGTLTISGSGEMPFWSADSQIPWYAYRTQITAVQLAADVTNISGGAFRVLTKATSISVDNGNAHFQVIDNALYDENAFHLYYYPAGRTDTSFTVPDTVLIIEHSAFCAANKLTGVQLPDILYYIDNYAFKNCSGLQSITFPRGLSAIGTDAFSGCYNLNNKHYHGDSALWNLISGSSALSSVVCDDDGAPYYGDEAGAAAYLREKLKDREQVILVYCGAGGSDLRARIYQQALAHTGDPNAGDALLEFQTYTGSETAASSGTLLRYYFVQRTTYDQEQALEAAIDSALASLALDGKDEYEKIYAIYDYICKNVTYDYANLNDDSYQLKFTAYAAMLNHTAVCNGYALLLYRMLLKAGIDCRFIGGTSDSGENHAWNIVKLGDLYYYCDATWDSEQTSYQYFLRGSAAGDFDGHNPDAEYTTGEYAAYPISETVYHPTKSGECGANLTWTLSEGVLHISGTGDMTEYAAATELPWNEDRASIQEVIIDEGVTRLSAFAFSNCTGLTALSIPDSVTTLGNQLVFGCSGLTEVHIGKGLINLSTTTFAYCTALQRFTVDPENTVFSTDEAGALLFYGTGLIAYPAGRAGEYTIPGSVTTVYGNAFFYATHMATLNIPTSVKTIQKSAFAYVSGLNLVNYAGTTAQWEDISIGTNNAALTNAVLRCTASEYAETGECGENLTWALDNSGVLTILGTGDMTDYGVSESPWCFDEKHVKAVIVEAGVTSIGANAFRGCTELTSVTFAEGLTRIGSYAFLGCDGLPAVNLPSSLTTIENYAFQECTGLTTFTVPAGLASMDGSAVKGCTGLTAFAIADGNTAFAELDGVLFNASMSELVAYPCGKTGAYTVPNGVSRIGFLAFFSCAGLTSITLPHSVTSIGEWAFANCTALTEATIAEGVTELPNGLFSGCSAMTDVHLPSTLHRVYNDAFDGCTALAHVWFGGTQAQWLKVTNMGTGNNALFYSAVIHFTDVAVVSEAGWYGTVYWQFFDDGTLKLSGSGEMANGTSANSFPWYKYVNAIKKVEIAEGVTRIGDYAFYNYDALQTATVPDSVTLIGQLVFSDCNALTTVEIGKGLLTIYPSSLAACPLMQSISVSVQNPYFRSIDGTMFTHDKKTLVAYPVGRSGDYTIPDGVLTIAGYAFCEAQNMPRLTIPAGLTTISNHAFAYVTGLTDVFFTGEKAQWDTIAIGEDNDALLSAEKHFVISLVDSGTCGDNLTWALDSTGTLTVSGTGNMASFANYQSTPWYSHADSILSVVVEDGVTSLTNWAFSYLPSLKHATIGSGLSYYESTAFVCSTALESITVSADNATFTSIAGVLYRKAPLELVTYPIGRSGNYALAEGTTAINAHAFLLASDTPVLTIPVTVDSIGKQAIAYISNMTKIIYLGTEAQWNDITVSSDNTSLGSIPREYLPSHTSHTYESTVTTAPTCETAGEKTYTCTVCGMTTYETLPALGHDLTHHAAQAATCTAVGWSAYDTCSRCDYSTYAEIPALGHDLTHHAAKAATCTAVGWNAYDTCSRCDYTTYTEIPALGHDLTHHDAKAATCTEIGWNAYDTCSRCDYSTYAEIAALGHDLTHHDAKAATCLEIGWNAYDTCSRCDYSTYTEIAALGHDLTHHDAKAATCTAVGWSAYDTCSRCDYTTYSEIPATGHDYVSSVITEPTCTAAGERRYTCTHDTTHTYTEPIDALGHNWSTTKLVIVEPSATAPGMKAYVCSRCGAHSEEEEVPYVPYIIGDANNDGVVNGKDTTTLRRYLAGGYAVTLNALAADVNHDGVVSGKDTTVLRRFLAGGYGIVLN